LFLVCFAGVIAPIPIGFAVLVDHLVGVPYTGASMNPARSFGPALVSGHWGRAHIIYWFGPCFGASLASAIYRCVAHAMELTVKATKPSLWRNVGLFS
jgi:aquaporin related protein